MGEEDLGAWLDENPFPPPPLGGELARDIEKAIELFYRDRGNELGSKLRELEEGPLPDWEIRKEVRRLEPAMTSN